MRGKLEYQSAQNNNEAPTLTTIQEKSMEVNDISSKMDVYCRYQKSEKNQWNWYICEENGMNETVNQKMKSLNGGNFVKVPSKIRHDNSEAQ